MDKSPEAFRTISEVADFLDTPAHVLRFWESRFPQIRPVKRAGGRRYYRPGDVALLAGIKKLLHDEGLTIRGVQKILREQGIRHVAGLASGDAAGLIDEGDIEAVLSAEYGPRDRMAHDETPQPEALQSAQIISLETALSRQDATREPGPVQPDLWAAAPLGTIDVPAATDVWSADKDVPMPDLPDLITAKESGVDAGRTDPEADGTFVDVTGEMAPATDVVPEVHQGAPADTVEEPDTEDSLEAGLEIGPEAKPETERDTGNGPESDSSAVTLAEDAEGAEDGQTATVASLLRRSKAHDFAAVQPQLIHLRDRLIDLRGRVAEAARRKAK